MRHVSKFTRWFHDQLSTFFLVIENRVKHMSGKLSENESPEETFEYQGKHFQEINCSFSPRDLTFNFNNCNWQAKNTILSYVKLEEILPSVKGSVHTNVITPKLADSTVCPQETYRHPQKQEEEWNREDIFVLFSLLWRSIIFWNSWITGVDLFNYL